MDPKRQLGTLANGLHEAVDGVSGKRAAAFGLEGRPPSCSAAARAACGQVQVYFVQTVASIKYIRTGQLRPLAVTTATRSEALPDIPTVDEFVPGYETSAWQGIGAPKNTPADIITGSTRRSTRALPIVSSSRGSPTWAACQCR